MDLEDLMVMMVQMVYQDQKDLVVEEESQVHLLRTHPHQMLRNQQKMAMAAMAVAVAVI